MIICHFYFMSYETTSLIFNPELKFVVLRCAVGRKTEFQSIWVFFCSVIAFGCDTKSRRDSAEDLVFIGFGFD